MVSILHWRGDPVIKNYIGSLCLSAKSALVGQCVCSLDVFTPALAGGKLKWDPDCFWFRCVIPTPLSAPLGCNLPSRPSGWCVDCRMNTQLPLRYLGRFCMRLSIRDFAYLSVFTHAAFTKDNNQPSHNWSTWAKCLSSSMHATFRLNTHDGMNPKMTFSFYPQ